MRGLSKGASIGYLAQHQDLDSESTIHDALLEGGEGFGPGDGGRAAAEGLIGGDQHGALGTRNFRPCMSAILVMGRLELEI